MKKFIRTRAAKGLAVLSIAALALTGCTTTGDNNEGDNNNAGGESGTAESLLVGTTDKVTVLDPAGSYDNGSYFVMVQVFPFLTTYKPGTSEIENGIAESAEFTSDTEYTVKLKKDLKFANGNTLDSSDVKFSFDRQLKIADANGPSSLLSAIESVETPDADTVVFKLNRENDQTFPLILAGPAGPIVDEEVFDADKITDDNTIVQEKAFGGPYQIDTYNFNQVIDYKANPNYAGAGEGAKTPNITMKYYADANNMKLDVQKGDIDVAWRSFSATDIEDLESKDNLTVHKGPGGEIRYIVFNLDTMPYGAKTDEADPAKATAVRQAAAHLIDREALGENVYKGTFKPLHSHVPEGMAGANEALKGLYGDGNGAPDAAKAKQVLEDAGVTTPVELKLQYNPDHYGPSSGDEYAQVKSQLEKDDLFKVDLQSTEWVQYAKDRTADVYPAYQLGWFPDYSDADNYLVPFFLNDGDKYKAFLANHYINEDVNKLLLDQVSNPDEEARAKEIGEIQDKLAEDLPTLPLLQGQQIAVADKDVKGVDETLDASYIFRLALLSK